MSYIRKTYIEQTNRVNSYFANFMWHAVCEGEVEKIAMKQQVTTKESWNGDFTP